jgi:hypothetical protein
MEKIEELKKLLDEKTHKLNTIKEQLIFMNNNYLVMGISSEIIKTDVSKTVDEYRGYIKKLESELWSNNDLSPLLIKLKHGLIEEHKNVIDMEHSKYIVYDIIKSKDIRSIIYRYVKGKVYYSDPGCFMKSYKFDLQVLIDML